MSDVLVLYAHPDPRRSRYNDCLIQAATAQAGVQVRDLYEIYPRMHVDVAAEQAALRAASAIVFQFPIYWFSAPALLKEWQDSVLTKGFAFGREGSALAGKPFLLAVSTGGAVGSYQRGEAHGAEIGAYLVPFEQTARFCGMKPVEPFVMHDVGQLANHEIEQAATDYLTRLAALTRDKAV